MKQRHIKSTTISSRKRGFTLIELMVAVMIIGILASIAYPLYIGIIQKARRSDARSALLEEANRQELFFSNNNTYDTSAGVSSSPEGFYSISVTSATGTGFTIQAIRGSGTSQEDDDCGNYGLDNTGAQSVTNTNNGMGVADCW